MDTNRFTETALQLLASAQQIAQTRRHASVTPLHLARSLLADADQPPARVLARAGGDLAQAQAALDAALGREPTVSGGAGEVYLAPQTGSALEAAEGLAKAWGDAFVAADKRYSFGTEMIVPGYNHSRTVKVLDRGGAIQGNRVDVFFHSHQEALEWGVKHLDVKVHSKSG